MATAVTRTGALEVTYAEAELLLVARALVTADGDPALDGALASATTLRHLSASAMTLLEDTLAKGAVRMLARLGGARARIRADTGTGTLARVHDVRPPPAIAFGGYTFELLRWLTNVPLGMRTHPPFTARASTLGDELAAYLAVRLVEGRRFERALAASPGIRGALAWLGFARPLAREHGPAAATIPSFDPLLATSEGRTVVECLAGDLARRWTVAAAFSETDVLEAEVAAAIVTCERAVLDAFLDAAERAGRLDLATFIIDAATQILPPGARPEVIAERLAPRVRPGGPLRTRTEARRRAGAIVQVLPRLGARYEELSLVRFIDEGYDVAQATLSSWEPFGRSGFARGAAVLAELASLAVFAKA